MIFIELQVHIIFLGEKGKFLASSHQWVHINSLFIIEKNN